MSTMMTRGNSGSSSTASFLLLPPFRIIHKMKLSGFCAAAPSFQVQVDVEGFNFAII